MKTKKRRIPVAKPMTKRIFRFTDRSLIGKRVSFHVENEGDWTGDLTGTLILDHGELKIETRNSGVLTIGKGFDVYGSTIEAI
ncbi:MAG: hypothetical protein WCS89_00530 [Candidatus Paceibacterota bacterium]|jgi:hypothetical protein